MRVFQCLLLSAVVCLLLPSDTLGRDIQANQAGRDEPLSAGRFRRMDQEDMMMMEDQDMDYEDIMQDYEDIVQDYEDMMKGDNEIVDYDDMMLEDDDIMDEDEEYDAECKKLKMCIEDVQMGPNGTWSFLRLTERPAKRRQWNKIWRPICNTRRDRTACLTEKNCLDRELRRKAKMARKEATMICRADGKEFLKGFYEDPDSCLANKTVYNMMKDYKKECAAKGKDLITENTSKDEKCALIQTTCDCYHKMAEKYCGRHGAWLVDNVMAIYKQVFYKRCVPDQAKADPYSIEEGDMMYKRL